MIKPKESLWHTLTVVETLKRLGTRLPQGLTDGEARNRLSSLGKNNLGTEKKVTLWQIILRQIAGPLSLILIGAMMLALLMQEVADSVVILIVILINVSVGSYQEYRANRAFNALSSSQAKTALVIRGGHQQVIKRENVVVGDLIVLMPGVSVPADARIISARSLSINESALTGEWADVFKQDLATARTAKVPDRKNMVYMGTTVTGGYGQAVVVATGLDTEIGIIANELNSEEVTTPLANSIKKLSQYIALGVIIILVLVVAFGLYRELPFTEIVLIAVALAVAAIPEGLPVALTVVLAVGMERILKRGGLVRNLLAAETLGSTTVILTDKTGTLTTGQMKVAELVTPSILGVKNRKNTEKEKDELLRLAILSTQAFIDEGRGDVEIHGRPAEKAIVSAGISKGIFIRALFNDYERLDYIPFDSKLRFAASLNRTKDKAGEINMIVTGAPEVLLAHSAHIESGGRLIKFSKDKKDGIRTIQESRASKGNRVLAVAYRRVDSSMFPSEFRTYNNFVLKDLVFVGIIVLSDPIRKDARSSIVEATNAGVKVIMVTGDQAPTAKTIAYEAGLYKTGDAIITGHEMESMSDEDLIRVIDKTAVFARILPHQKMRLAEILRAQGEVVAMTGDGVNDAPALHHSNIGVALGSGTDVAKEASDLVLIDNNFSIIVYAIEEGRRLLDNLKKIVAYLLSTSLSEIILVLAALFIGMPIPILATQILWANMVGEGLMNFAFVFEPKEKDIMKRSPRLNSQKSLLSRDLKVLVGIVSLVTSIVLVTLYLLLVNMGTDIEKVRTIIFAALSVGSMFFALSLKNLRTPIWKMNILSNPYLVLAMIASLGMLCLALFTKPLQNLLTISPLNIYEMSGVLLIGIFNLLVIELIKRFGFRDR